IGQGLQELRGRAALVFGDRHDADPREEPVETAEGAATVELTRHLPDHVALADATFNLVNLVAGRVAETSAGAIPMPLAKQITLVLLVRLGNDLRSITRLGMTGYPLQAATLTASAYEIACAIVLIGTDAARAREWVEHKDPQSLPSFLQSVPTATVE